MTIIHIAAITTISVFAILRLTDTIAFSAWLAVVGPALTIQWIVTFWRMIQFHRTHKKSKQLLEQFDINAYKATQSMHHFGGVVQIDSPVEVHIEVAHSYPEEAVHNRVKPLMELWPTLTERLLCPGQICKQAKRRTLAHTLQHLNDHHKWSREQIANWLESTEWNVDAKGETDGYSANNQPTAH